MMLCQSLLSLHLLMMLQMLYQVLIHSRQLLLLYSQQLHLQPLNPNPLQELYYLLNHPKLLHLLVKIGLFDL